MPDTALNSRFHIRTLGVRTRYGRTLIRSCLRITTIDPPRGAISPSRTANWSQLNLRIGPNISIELLSVCDCPAGPLGFKPRNANSARPIERWYNRLRRATRYWAGHTITGGSLQ